MHGSRWDPIATLSRYDLVSVTPLTSCYPSSDDTVVACFGLIGRVIVRAAWSHYRSVRNKKSAEGRRRRGPRPSAGFRRRRRRRTAAPYCDTLRQPRRYLPPPAPPAARGLHIRYRYRALHNTRSHSGAGRDSPDSAPLLAVHLPDNSVATLACVFLIILFLRSYKKEPSLCESTAAVLYFLRTVLYSYDFQFDISGDEPLFWRRRTQRINFANAMSIVC
ncbi:hypothetical protein EVAR_74759_1 [Eumeta japonica]|uniref:Uncharacterized protein n=1 Tax=Eumeta variegata TaxID=151549 RepID=A0A4C1SP14_EUMVA|nr:hypothetical protein EVAR_74759_1 [Eumeta japonica]